jgi:hypothetical protein
MANDWNSKHFPAGTRVIVFDLDNKPLGTGTMVHSYTVGSDENAMPEIVLANGKTVMGYECWWIPEEEAREVEKKLAGEVEEEKKTC